MLISNVAQLMGVSSRMLRHYDRIGLMKPSKRTASGYRAYTLEDIQRLFYVESLRSLGMSLTEVSQAIDAPDFRPSTVLSDLVTSSKQRIAKEKDLLRYLKNIQSENPKDWHELLHTISQLRTLNAPNPSRRLSAILSNGTQLPVEVLFASMITETDAGMAGALKWALVQKDKAALPYLQEVLKGGKRTSQVHALDVISKINGDVAFDILHKTLTHPDPTVRRHASIAAGRRGDIFAIDELARMISEGIYDVEAAEILGVLAEKTENERLVVAALSQELSRKSLSSDNRVRITQAFGEINSSLALRHLQRLANDVDVRVANTARYLMNQRV